MAKQVEVSHKSAVEIVADTITIADAEAAFLAAGLPVLDFASLTGDSWGEIVDKQTLVDVPFLIVDVKFNQGDFGEYAAVLIMLKDGSRAVFTDGSSGVCQQLLRLQDMTDGRMAGIAVRRGLKKSEYEKDGRLAHTYWLAN